MAPGKKLDLEELRKSFPALDENSVSKLLGGGGHNPDGWTPPPVGSDMYDMPELASVDIYPSGSGSDGSSGGPGGPRYPGGSGSDYFGDGDGGDDYGDYVFGGGWGDSDGGTDTNPGGSEGGNGQNSSGNPGNEFSGTLVWLNSPTLFPSHVTQVINDTNQTIWYKPEHNMPYGQPNAFPIPPGGSITAPIDGLNINGVVYKFVDGYSSIYVTNTSYTTHYNAFMAVIQSVRGGVLRHPPNDHAYEEDHGASSSWQDLFDAIP